MENRNIYKMDDVLIIASSLMLIPAIYFSWPWLKLLPQAEDYTAYFFSAPEILGARLSMVGLYLGGSVFTQIFGRIIRRQEKQALDVLDTILYMKNTSVDQLAVNLNMSRSKVTKITVKLSRITSLNIKIEGDTVTVKSAGPDLQPPRSTPSFSTETSQSPVFESETSTINSTSINKEPEISPREFEEDEESASPFDREAIMEKLKDNSLDPKKRRELMLRLAVFQENGKKDTIQKAALNFSDISPEDQKKMKKNAVILIILFMTPLWPVALIMIVAMIVKQAKKAKESGPSSNASQSSPSE